MIEKVGRYRIERELGRGGMGVVYLAEDPRLGRKVAIKTVHFEITDPVKREYLREQLLRDARASAGLSHPNVVSVHDIIEEGDTTYLVMEYIAGETLLARMHRPPTPDTAWLLRALRDIAVALDYTHRKGVVHRDVKPGNVMIDHQGRVRILDFGLARNADRAGAARSGLVAGTIQYMSPEQIRGDAIDGRADQFSLAAVAYELLSGTPLFDAESPTTLAYKIVNEVPALAHLKNPTIPAATSAVLAKALDRDPANRFPNCGAFVDALIATFDGETVQALLLPPEEQPTMALTGLIDTNVATQPITAQPPGKDPRTSNLPIWITAGLGTLALGLTAVMLQNGRSHGPAPASVATAQTPGVSAPAAPKMPALPPRPMPEKKGPPPDRAEPFDGALPPEPPGTRKDGGRPDGPPPEFREGRKGKRPRNAEFEAGRTEMKARNFGLAVEHFNKAIAEEPSSPVFYFSRGMAYLGEEKMKAADDDFQKAVELKPDDAQAWFQIGVIKERQRKMKEALADYSKASSIFPGYAEALVAAAGILDREGIPDKAIAELDKAIAANPGMIKAYQMRGALRRKVGDPGAADDLKKAKELQAERQDPK